jgi:RimJ/RimL family protein N-acetyltransferase
MSENNGYFWEGRLVRLRPLRADDWKQHYAEDRDSEAIRVFEARVQLPGTPEQIQEWIERKTKAVDEKSPTFAVETLDCTMVGTANIHGLNDRDGTFSLAIRIYRPFQRRGYAKDATRILLRYGFYELRCQKCNSATISSNEASIRMHLDLGFQIEGRIRRNAYTNGQYYDEVLFGMTREEFDASEGV